MIFQVFFEKKSVDFNKKESEILDFTRLEIPIEYLCKNGGLLMKQYDLKDIIKKTEKITLGVLILFFFGFAVLCLGKPSDAYSVAERRKLEQFPELTLSTVADGTFMEKFEAYTLDQIPFRDSFRNLKAWVSKEVFRKADNNDIYVEDGYAVKMEYPLKEESLTYAADRFSHIYEKYLKGYTDKIYLSVIPDKNYFLAEKSGHLSVDYEKIFGKMQQKMPYAQYIDVTDTLDITDYYCTDIHWRQEKLVDTAQKLGNTMGITYEWEYEKKTLEQQFYGVYFGQSALDLPGETLDYLTNEELEQCTVYNYENEKTGKIYDLEKAEGLDPYELFLSGSVSLLEIENPNASTERELIVFRDSFGSSLIPLLAEGYATITLVDLRYIQSDILGKFVDFQNKDVLFLYSTTVLMHSETLK